ncbi:hypothetical protein [Pseudochrobactrum kiredjianiae]|uniref:Uncharacterized protein n=1 Tax=Pseudochrobactrum kiredjianiae TaxID=386305 RepID=A0ABW3UZR8_9HYPH|nr:hypothetical protein [Pseudochrobactrum kiredjianiae]MDM7852330.1 hypothetical protein [Pseudochrobactrum kiredjianiae]
MPERIYASVPSSKGCVVSFDIPSLAYDVEYIRADVAANHLSVPSAVEVVKLDWSIPFPHGTQERAESVFGTYAIWEFGGEGYYRTPSATAGTPVQGGQTEAKAAAQADFERRIFACVVTKPVDVAAAREELEDLTLPIVGSLFVSRGGATVRGVSGLEKGEDEHSPLVRLSDVAKALEPFRAISAEPAQDTFDSADWFYRDNDPDDNGDTAYEAIVNHPEYSVHLVHSSYRGDSRFVFRAPTLNQDDDDDDDETLNFATEEEAMAAVIERKKVIEAQTAAPTAEAGR